MFYQNWIEYEAGKDMFGRDGIVRDLSPSDSVGSYLDSCNGAVSDLSNGHSFLKIYYKTIVRI